MTVPPTPATPATPAASAPVPVPVFLYGDYGCPFTYIERARLDLLASEGSVQIAWRALPSSGGPTAESLAGTGGDPGGLTHDAAELGLSFSIPKVRPDTRAAAQAAEFARDCGPDVFRRLQDALFRAVFVEQIDLGEEAVLLEIADGARVDREGLAAALADGRYLDTLGEIDVEAERYDIDSTPTLLIGRFKVVGAAPLELLRKTVAQASAS